jgi:hypothetical protein
MTALRLADRLVDWNGRHGPGFSAKHAPVFALSVAFVTPWLDFAVLLTATRIWSWITAVDDVATRPGFPRLAPLWRDTVDRLLAGMRFEAAAASAAPAPDLETYLEHGAQTVGVPMYMVALWAAMDGVDPTPLLPPLRDSALAVRLANDARGHAREDAEQAIGALRLGVSLADVRRMVGDRIARCRRALGPLLTRGDPAAIALDRLTIWSTRLYQQVDFRRPEGEGADKRDWAPLHWPSPQALGAA